MYLDKVGDHQGQAEPVRRDKSGKEAGKWDMHIGSR